MTEKNVFHTHTRPKKKQYLIYLNKLTARLSIRHKTNINKLKSPLIFMWRHKMLIVKKKKRQNFISEKKTEEASTFS